MKYHRLEAGGFPQCRMNSTIIPLPLRERSPRSRPAAGQARGHNLAEVFSHPHPCPLPFMHPREREWLAARTSKTLASLQGEAKARGSFSPRRAGEGRDEGEKSSGGCRWPPRPVPGDGLGDRPLPPTRERRGKVDFELGTGEPTVFAILVIQCPSGMVEISRLQAERG